MSYDKRWLLCLAVWFSGILYAEDSPTAPGDGLILIEGREFELVCVDRIAGNSLRGELYNFGQFATRLFRVQGEYEAWPVRVVWVDPPRSGKPWEVSWGGLNQVVLTISDQATQDDRSLYEGLAAAWLMREAVSIGGIETVENIPEWIISGLALDFIKSRYPSADAAWLDMARQEQPLPLRDLLELSYAESGESWGLATQAWHLFDRLLAMAVGQEEKVTVARALLSGGDPRVYISQRAFREESTPNSFAEVWWISEWDRFVWDGVQRVWPLDMSRADLERLAFWSLKLDGNEVWIDASIFLKRDGILSTELALQMEKRVTYIKRAFAQINPAYANALHSLGLYYEALLLEKQTEAAQIWETFSRDIRSGREIWQAIQRSES
ncbi:MAG: hypothetical protein ACPGN3_08790 [Opitutales bacterium]